MLPSSGRAKNLRMLRCQRVLQFCGDIPALGPKEGVPPGCQLDVDLFDANIQKQEL